MLKKPSNSSSADLFINVGARSSPLSRVQVDEVLAELREQYPHVTFNTHFTETVGDRDLKTSLRALDKTDFFTQEVDAMLLEGRCRIGIHSAKDLPEPLAQGLTIVAITKGVDPSDTLVLRDGATLESLIPHGRVATSSVRREEGVLELFREQGYQRDEPPCTFVDIRGTIGQRLAKLDSGEVDAVVIAEAALIRLGIRRSACYRLPGDTVPGQGQLAIVAPADDQEMEALFQCIDSRVAVS